MGVTPAGLAVLDIYNDKERKGFVRLFGSFDGLAGLGVRDNDEKIRVMADVHPDGLAHLVLSDKDEKKRSQLGVAADGTPVLTHKDKEGKVIWSAP